MGKLVSSIQVEEKQALMRQPGAILLISCYELGHQPIGIAQPMAFLEQKGYAPTAMDIAVEDFDVKRVQQARFIGISVPMHTALTLGLQVAKRVRESNPSAHTCFYGLYASLNADYLLRWAADSVIGGEYELPLLNLIDHLADHVWDSIQGGGSKNQVTVPIEGVSTRHHISAPYLKRVSWATNRRDGKDGDHPRFPIPSRRQLQRLERYARLEHHGRQELVGYVEASRGCLHHCLHCPIVPVYQGRFFLMPEESVLGDIRQHVQAGATHITFGDPDFLNGPGHSLNILRSMHQEFPHLTFDFTAKIEHILKRHTLFQELSDLGCLFVISAVESFSDTVLSHLQKGHTRKDVLAALNIVRSAGIALRPSLVSFTPWTTLADYLEMFDLIERYDLIDAIDPVHYTIRLLIPPGSALLTSPIPHPSPIHEFLGPLDQEKFQYQWRHPDPRMDQLHRVVTKIVEKTTKNGEEPEQIFCHLWNITHEAVGKTALKKKSPLSIVKAGRQKLPRLTESWFCCAEPTTAQFESVDYKPNGVG